MADDKQAEQEQSMEEILASIRKIISEDEEHDAVAEPDEDDDILDLGEPLPDDDFAAAPVAADDEDEPAAEAPVDMTSDDDDADELIVEDIAEPEDEPAPEPEPEFEPEPEPVPVPEPALQSAPEPEPAFEPEPAPAGDGLLSPESAALTAAALASLRGGGVSGEMSIGGDNSLEGLVRELLRPMLKQWLDVHLPSMVENLVREEIRRLQRGGRD